MRFYPPLVLQTNAGKVWGKRVCPLRVGLVPWEPRQERTTVVVKASYDVGREATLARESRPFGRGRPATRRGALPLEVDEPDDLVAVKLGADLLFGGSAYAGRAVERIAARVCFGDAIDLSFVVQGPAPVERMPLAGEFLRQPDGVTALPPVGAVRARAVAMPADEEDVDAMTPEERKAVLALLAARFAEHEAQAQAVPLSSGAEAHGAARSPDTGRVPEETWAHLPTAAPYLGRGVQCAAAHLTTAFLIGGERLELTGLLPGGGDRVLTLPNHVPLVLAEGNAGRFVVEMLCDTVLLDDDGLTMTWRGQVPEDLLASPISRLVVTLAERGSEPELSTVMGELARAHYGRAEVPEAADIQVPPSPDAELIVARLANGHATPEPMLSQAEFVQLRAALSSDSTGRRDWLSKHGLDEHEWSLEVRAWSAVANRARSRGDTSLAVALDRAGAEARRKLRSS